LTGGLLNPSQERQDADPVLLDVGKAARQVLTRSYDEGGFSMPPSPAGDHFSTFLPFGAARNLPVPAPATVEQGLRADVLRAKRQLLEVALQTELRALDPRLPDAELAKTLRQLRQAHNYLRDPSRANEAMSEFDGQEAKGSDVKDKLRLDMDISAMAADTTAPLSPIQPASPFMGSRASASRTLNGSTSLPNIRVGVSDTSILPAIGDFSRPGMSMPTSSSAREANAPMLSAWWSKTQSWNIGLRKRDTRARRQTLGLPGGTVVLGNGRLPNFSTSNYLAKGYFFAFQIDEIDEDHFPLSTKEQKASQAGAKVVAKRAFKSMYGQEIRRGAHAIVLCIDKDGDARIQMGGADPIWVYKRDLCNFKVFSGCEESDDYKFITDQAASSKLAIPPPSETEEVELKAKAFKAVVKDDADALISVLEVAPRNMWENWENKAGKNLLALSQERGSTKAYSILAQSLGISEEGCASDEKQDMSLVLGVSRVNARHRFCERPVYAYEVPGTVLVGYGGHLIDKGKWKKTGWDARTLKVNDTVGVLVTEDGDLVVYVNEEQVLRVPTSLGEKTSADDSLANLESEIPAGSVSPSDTLLARKTSKRILYPILDLHGRVCAVTLLPRMSPPNVPLEPRSKLP
jgi:hypothetical protein